MKDFYCKILAADKAFYEGHALSVTVNAHDGEMGFLPEHSDTIAAIEMGQLRITTPEGETIVALAGDGILSMINNRMLVLTESVERPEEIDKVRAREAMERAQERLRQKNSMQEYHTSRAALARAITRLRETDKNNPLG